MIKIIYGVILLVGLLSAKNISIVSLGTYTQLKYSQNSHTPDETNYARKQALIQAKSIASEEAGTTVYTSISSRYNNSEDKVELKSDMQAISSAIITYKIISEGWKNDKYTVKIKANVDTKDAEEIFKKADARLKKIKELQVKNETILKDIALLSERMINYNRNKYTTDNIRDVKNMNSKIDESIIKQALLAESYEDNTLLMRTQFYKGELYQIAKKNDRDFERAKRVFDEFVMKPFKQNLIVKILNVDVVRHEKEADVRFLIGMKVKKSYRANRNIREWISGRKISKNIYSPGKAYCTLLFNDKGSSVKLIEWLKENRSLVVKVNLGSRVYITERWAYYSTSHETATLMYTKKGSYDGSYKIFNNTYPYVTERIIKNIPIDELKDIDMMRADLVYSSVDITKNMKKRYNSDYSLPMVREASEYY